MGLEVPRAAVIMAHDVVPCNLVLRYQHFSGTSYSKLIYSQSSALIMESWCCLTLLVWTILCSITSLNTNAADFSKTLVFICYTT